MRYRHNPSADDEFEHSVPCLDAFFRPVERAFARRREQHRQFGANITDTEKSASGDNIRDAASQDRAGLIDDDDEVTEDGQTVGERCGGSSHSSRRNAHRAHRSEWRAQGVAVLNRVSL